MRYYFQLQLIRIGRWFREFGVPPIIGGIGSVVLFVLASAVLFSKTSLAAMLTTATAILTLSSISGSTRTSFLSIIFEHRDVIVVRVLESLLCVIPFLFVLIYFQEYIYAAIVLLSAFVFGFIRIRHIQHWAFPTPFSTHPFEFIAGIRTTMVPILLIHVLLGIAIYVNNRNLALFTIALMFALFSTYYAGREVNYYLWIHNYSPSEFLIQKMKNLTAHAFITCLPLCIIILFCYPEYALYIVLIVISGIAFVASIMLAKYSFYPHNVSLGVAMVIGMSLFFPPLLLLVLPYLYYQSLSNLRLYLSC